LQHQLIVWTSKVIEKPLTAEDHDAFYAALRGRAWVEVAPGVIIAFLSFPGENAEFINAINEAAKTRQAARGATISVVAAPPSPSGQGTYGGLWPAGKWAEVGKRIGLPPELYDGSADS